VRNDMAFGNGSVFPDVEGVVACLRVQGAQCKALLCKILAMVAGLAVVSVINLNEQILITIKV